MAIMCLLEHEPAVPLQKSQSSTHECPVIPIQALRDPAAAAPEADPATGRSTPRRSPRCRLAIGRPLRSDLLIEHLHALNDRFGQLRSDHLAALAQLLKLSQAEVYEVASFYHHFDVVREDAKAASPRAAA